MLEPKVNKDIKRLEYIRKTPVKTVQFLKKVVSKETEHWYESKNVWLAALQIGYALYSSDYKLLLTAASQIIGRMLTGDGLKK